MSSSAWEWIPQLVANLVDKTNPLRTQDPARLFPDSHSLALLCQAIAYWTYCQLGPFYFGTKMSLQGW
jgi:hypothetical protein